jgi:hypothetical protein
MVPATRPEGKSSDTGVSPEQEAGRLLGLLAADPSDAPARVGLGQLVTAHPRLIVRAGVRGAEWRWYQPAFLRRVAARQAVTPFPADHTPPAGRVKAAVRVAGREAELLTGAGADTYRYLLDAGWGGPFVPVLVHGPVRLLVVDAAGVGDGRMVRPHIRVAPLGAGRARFCREVFPV